MRSSRHLSSSLLPLSCHNFDFVHLMHQRHVSPEMICFVALRTTGVIRIQDDVGIPTPPVTPHKASFDDDEQCSKRSTSLPSLELFISNIVKAANVQVPVLLATVIYLERVRSKLPIMAKGMPCTRHRMFLATMIVAAKYLNDSSPRNVHWTKHAAYFELSEINLMEKQLLHLLDYDLRFEEQEACMQFAQFLPTKSPQERRAAAVSVVTKASQARAQAQMPPTPPHDAVMPETPAVLRGPTEHTSSAFLCVPSEARHPLSSRSCSSNSTPSIDSCSSDVSEMSSLTEDTDSPVSSDTSCDNRERVFDIERAASRTFNLMPVPVRAYRQGKIPSNLTATSDETISEIKIKPCSDISSSPSPVRLVALETLKSSSRLCTVPKHSSSYMTCDTRSLSSSAFSTTDQPRDVSWSSSLPSMTRKPSSSGVGFLSRMWGAATRGAQDKSEKTDVFTIGIAEPDTQYGQTSSAFRRLVHSRSALFRGSAQAENNV